MKAVLSLLAFIFCLSVQAQFLTEQKNHYSFNTGVSFIEYFGDVSDSPDFELGLQAEIMASKRVALALAVNYIYDEYTPGWFTDDIYSTTGFYRTGRAHSLYIPIKFNWYFYQKNGNYWSMSVGPSFNFLVSKTYKKEYEDGRVEVNKTHFDINNLNPKIAAYLGFDYTNIFLQTEQGSYFFKSGFHIQEVFYEFYNKSQFALNIGIGMAL